MKSACIFKDTLRNDTQVFLKFRDSIFENCLHLINSNCTSYFLPSSMLSSGAGTSKKIPLHESGLSVPPVPITLSFFIFCIQLLDRELYTILFIKVDMSFNTLINSENSDVFFVEPISNEPSAQRNNSPNMLNSTEMSHTHTARMPSVSSIASPETQILTIHDDTNEPTMPNGLGRQLPIVPTSLNDLNLPPNPFHILATMVVVNHTAHGKDDIYSPQSPEPYELSLISTAPKNVSTFDNWETSHTTTDDNNFYYDDEPVRIYFLPSTPTPPPPPRKMKKNEIENVLSKRRGSVAARPRSLRTDDSLSKGHPKSIKQQLEL